MIRQGQNRGFTLIEMLVAIGIFVMVAFVITVAFLNLTNAYRKSQSIRLITDNLNFAMDSMALKLREGSNYTCDSSSCSPSPDITFTTFDGEKVSYRLAEDDGDEFIEMCATNDVNSPCTSYQRITAKNIRITDLDFYIKEVDQPSVLMVIKGEANVSGQVSTYNLQTTISRRNY